MARDHVGMGFGALLELRHLALLLLMEPLLRLDDAGFAVLFHLFHPLLVLVLGGRDPPVGFGSDSRQNVLEGHKNK